MEEKSGFGYFLLGLGIGVAAGILWAPRSGEETRQLIAERAGEGADYLRTARRRRKGVYSLPAKPKTLKALPRICTGEGKNDRRTAEREPERRDGSR